MGEPGGARKQKTGVEGEELPEDIAALPHSHTGRFLAPMLGMPAASAKPKADKPKPRATGAARKPKKKSAE